ncbi:Dolichyl-diphosphooligosaccharide--protein glycosyltransferase 48 kDa subunit [Morus notabilis]|uniref:Dolichyl-diphosphooligosaccharide--protein glycosyltransferase 48 kDa subunit n=1 Tax=Morus notabilis TaxID=981085 RepID=W9R992_9ROSA|nr:Dolichyl-diphosphooligosaccharide--protein glycosyltransferase 48 kDa subunit [Morus notabilis]
MAKLIAFLTLTLILPFLCTSFSPERPTDRRVLVLLDDLALKSSHSFFFKSLQSCGFDLDFKLAENPKIGLQRYGQYLYDALILFSPAVDRFGGSIDVAAILDFVDSGRDLIIASDVNASDLVREIAIECGVDFDEDSAALVIDHTSYAVSGTEGDHTLIASDDFINSDVILGSRKIEASSDFDSVDMFCSIKFHWHQFSNVLKHSKRRWIRYLGCRRKWLPWEYGSARCKGKKLRWEPRWTEFRVPSIDSRSSWYDKLGTTAHPHGDQEKTTLLLGDFRRIKPHHGANPVGVLEPI